MLLKTTTTTVATSSILSIFQKTTYNVSSSLMMTTAKTLENMTTSTRPTNSNSLIHRQRPTLSLSRMAPLPAADVGLTQGDMMHDTIVIQKCVVGHLRMRELGRVEDAASSSHPLTFHTREY
jgi:hypothetical protein